MKCSNVLVLVCALLFFAGCAHRPAPQPTGDWSERQLQLEQLTRWEVAGKLGVRVPGDNGSATLRWRQVNADYTLDLSGPLGSGRVAITGKPGRVTLLQAGEEPVSATTAEELILYSTGWTIPVAQLTYWVRALPAPNEEIILYEKNAADQLTLLEQAGWRIRYSDYQTVRGGKHNVLLPNRVVAEYDDVRLTLVIREWQLSGARRQ